MTTTYLIIAFVIAQIADAVTTIIALDRKGTKEANPLLRWAFGKIGIAPSLFTFKVAIVAMVIWFKDIPGMNYVLAGLLALYAAVLVNNLRVLLR